MKKQNIKIKLKNMSKNSGVYKMLDRTGNVIYIGKAKNLKNRVSQYFTNSNHNNKMQVLQKNIYDCKYDTLWSSGNLWPDSRNGAYS